MKNHLRTQIDKLVNEVADNPEELQPSLDRLESERRFADALAATRKAAGLSQRGLAQAACLGLSKIGRMERGKDATLRIGDIQTYLTPLGATLHVTFAPPIHRHPSNHHIRQQIDKAIEDIFEEDAAEVKERLNHLEEERRLADSLFDACISSKLSFQGLADASGLGIAKISRMICGKDAALSIGDIQTFLKPLGITPRFSLRTSRPPPTRLAQ